MCGTCTEWFAEGAEIADHPDGGYGHINCVDPWETP